MAAVDRIVGDYGQGLVLKFTGVSLEDSTVLIRVLKPNGQKVTWNVIPSNVDSVLNRAVYVFQDGDIDVKGPYRIQGEVTKTTSPQRRTHTVPVVFEVGEEI